MPFHRQFSCDADDCTLYDANLNFKQPGLPRRLQEHTFRQALTSRGRLSIVYPEGLSQLTFFDSSEPSFVCNHKAVESNAEISVNGVSVDNGDHAQREFTLSISAGGDARRSDFACLSGLARASRAS